MDDLSNTNYKQLLHSAYRDSHTLTSQLFDAKSGATEEDIRYWLKKVEVTLTQIKAYVSAAGEQIK